MVDSSDNLCYTVFMMRKEMQTVLVGKLKTGQLVQVLKFAARVSFSAEQGWILVVSDFDKPVHRQQGISWVPATTQFCWIREFISQGEA